MLFVLVGIVGLAAAVSRLRFQQQQQFHDLGTCHPPASRRSKHPSLTPLKGLSRKDSRTPTVRSSATTGKPGSSPTTAKPPARLTYHPTNGDKLYSAGGSVNEKNSFGGYVGDQMYGCDASVTTQRRRVRTCLLAQRHPESAILRGTLPLDVSSVPFRYTMTRQ